MLKVSIIGSGNVAQHLITVFDKTANVEIVQVYARQKNGLSNLINIDKIIDNFNNFIDADVYIISVSDDAINQVSANLLFKNKLVVHTAGGVSIDVLDKKNRKGVFYPLQSFTKNKPINFVEIPICIESENEKDYQILEKLAHLISKKVYKIDSNQRKSLHISAVFVNNFVNHLYQIGNDICNAHQVDFEILKALILETAQKIITISPSEAQTGPAKRDDKSIINSHLEFLSDENQKEIYKILTQSIQTNGKKL